MKATYRKCNIECNIKKGSDDNERIMKWESYKASITILYKVTVVLFECGYTGARSYIKG